VRQTWQAIVYVLAGARSGPAAFVALGALVLTAALSVVAIGVPLLRPALEAVRATAGTERRRAGRLLGCTIPDPSRPSSGGWWSTTWDPSTRREITWTALHAATGLPLATGVVLTGVIAIGGLLTPIVWWVLPPGETMTFMVPVTSWARALTAPPLFAAVALAVLYWGVPPIARTQARVCRALLAPSVASLLTARVHELAATRADALDAHAAELRRIERDLHDGPQARLVAIAIQLAVAQRQRDTAPEVADQLIENARSGVDHALVELRGVARGVYPPILADRGLPGAVHALVADCPVPLALRVGPMSRLPAAVESAAYFVIAESLANIAKHSHATGGSVDLDVTGDRLVLTIADDGVGGADEHRGTGLAGIRRRIAALDGHVALTSPAGGPTALRAELPCAW
jgi:signal transduction histidine kinase